MDQSISTLGQAIGNGGGSDASLQAPPDTSSLPVNSQPAAPSMPAQPTVAPPAKPSRLQQILGAVASIGSTALAGIPDKGRSSFVTGLGEGARSEQAAQAQQQEYRFRQFSDQVRAAQLHNEALRMQWADEDHQAAVQANTDAQAKRMTDTTGMTYTFVPNDDNGQAVLTHWGGQMAQDGHVSIPAGTIAGPKGWYIPNKGSAEQAAANTQDYNSRAAFYGLSPVPQGKVVNDAAYDILRKMSNGFDAAGNPIHANDIQARVDNMKEQLAKYKQSPSADFNTTNAIQSDIDHLQNLQQITAKRESDALKQAQAQQLDMLNKSEAIKAKYAEEKQDNAASDKQPKASVGSIVGYDPQTNERVVVNASDPKASTLSQSSKVSGMQLDNWGTAQNQFANVQLAVSRYDQAARNFAQSGKPSDIVGINSALNKTGIGDVQIGEWGVRVPGFSFVAEAASRVANSTAFKNLSPAGQDLVDKYFRMMSSIPEYQKASTGIGRTNKEMLDLELKNIPDPTMPPAIISNRLGSFQEALSSNASRVPRIQGIPHYKDVAQHYQQSSQPTGGNNLGKAVTMGNTDFINRLQPNR